MRLQVHRGQALLLVMVGGLAAAVIAGATFERSGVAGPVAARAAGMLGWPAGRLPADIEIGGRLPDRDATVAAAQPAATPAPAASAGGAGPPRPSERPGDGATVVPPLVYTYQRDDGTATGGDSGDGSGGSGRTGRDGT
jgi:hypothetical protein